MIHDLILSLKKRYIEEFRKNKIFQNIFWNLISVSIAQGFPFIAAIFTARILGTIEYGQFGLINGTIVMFSTFSGLGLGLTATRYIARFNQNDKPRTGRIISLLNIVGILSGSLMFIILFMIAPWLSKNFLANPLLSFNMQIAALLLITNTMIGIQSGTISGFGNFRSLAHISLFQGIITFPITIIGVYLFGLTGLIIALVINSIITLFLYIIGVNSVLKQYKIILDYLNSIKEKYILWKFSFPSMLSSIFVSPVIWVAYAILINTPGGYAQLGIFIAVDLWRNLISFLPNVIGNVLIPHLSANIEKTEKKLELINALMGWGIVTLISLPIMAFPEIISILYGKEYISSAFFYSLTLMALVSCIIAYKEGISRKLVAQNLMWWGFLNNLFWAVILIGTIFILKDFGSIGLSLSFLIAYVSMIIVFVPFFLSKKVIPKKLIISRQVFLIWGALILQVTMTLFNLPFLIRSIVLILNIIIIFYSFNSIRLSVLQSYINDKKNNF